MGSLERIHRHINTRVREALGDTRVVSLVGPRQAGKSTLARALAAEHPDARYLTLDDEATRSVALSDPNGLVSGHPGLVVIDEIQRAPALMLAIKLVVDEDPRPGRFLLTGSTHLLAARDVADTLAGRIELLELWPFSQGELLGVVETLVDRLFADDDPPLLRSELTRSDYVDRVLTGGYPEAIGRHGRRRSDWFRNYIETVVQRESKDVIDTNRGGDIVRLLRFVAARHGGMLNVADLARESGIAERTAHRYLHLLESVFLITRTPAYWANLSSQLTKASKITIADSGLAAYLRRADVELLKRPETGDASLGALTEGFVIGEIRRQLSWSDTPADMFHFRDRNGREADILLEGPGGRIVAIEVKTSTSINQSAFAGLAHVRDQLGERFHRGVVLHAGRETLRHGPNMWSMPIAALWS